MDLNFWLNKVEKIDSLEQLYKIKNEIFNKINGVLFLELEKFKKLSIEEKKINQKEINHKKDAIENLIKQKEKELSKKKINLIDHTYIKNSAITKPHILTESINLFHQIFQNLGFINEIGPDVEDVYYNFDALRMPLNHASRDNQDTFYINEKKLLRTQTTNVQIRTLEKMQNVEEIRSYSIGTVYRNDTHDSTHLSVFHQIECIVIEENLTIEHLKGLIEHIANVFFESSVQIEFKPSYFPFTEPSFEVFAKMNNKMLEIGGSGIIHPEILENFNKKNKIGFAFGLGLERWIMLKHNLTNLNQIYSL